MTVISSASGNSSISEGSIPEDDFYPIHHPSWELVVYVSAIESAEFLRHVIGQLDASDPATEASYRASVEKCIHAKYYSAGGNVNFMFACSTAEVAEDVLDDLVRRGAGGVLARSKTGEVDVPSSYVPVLVAIIWGVEAFRYGGNFGWAERRLPGKRSLMLEVFFFARLTLYCGLRVSDHGKELHWPVARVKILDLGQVDQYMNEDCPLWIKVLKHDCGGYDAVYVDAANGLMRLVQIASCHGNVLNLEHFARLVHQVARSGFQVRALEVFVVVERSELAGFEFAEVSGGDTMR